MNVHATCPRCEQPLASEPNRIGKPVRCCHCGGRIVVFADGTARAVDEQAAATAPVRVRSRDGYLRRLNRTAAVIGHITLGVGLALAVEAVAEAVLMVMTIDTHSPAEVRAAVVAAGITLLTGLAAASVGVVVLLLREGRQVDNSNHGAP